MTDGAGAWQHPMWYGKDTCGTTVDGVDDADRHRIRWAAKSIEAELKSYGYLGASVVPDGVFRDKTDQAIREFQKDHHLIADGGAGKLTCRAIFRPVVIWEETMGRIKIPNHYLHGMLMLESLYDPGAEGSHTENGIDRGIAQINSVYNPSITPAMAYSSPRMGIAFVATRLREARRHQDDELSYGDVGRWDCAILDHNSPVNADKLFDTGKYPSQQAKDYVDHVMERAAKF